MYARKKREERFLKFALTLLRAQFQGLQKIENSMSTHELK